MMKYYQITMKDGSVWRIPLYIILESRTSYYANHDGFERDSKEWKEEWEYVENDVNEVQDWACNNMNWEDVKRGAVQVKKPSPTNYEKMWGSPEKYEIIENEAACLDCHHIQFGGEVPDRCEKCGSERTVAVRERS